jgi:hypothetical protein
MLVDLLAASLALLALLAALAIVVRCWLEGDRDEP